MLKDELWRDAPALAPLTAGVLAPLRAPGPSGAWPREGPKAVRPRFELARTGGSAWSGRKVRVMRASRYVLLALAGLFVSFAGAVFCTEIPDQDPPPELRAHPDHYSQVGDALWYGGLGIVLVTVLVGSVRLVQSLFARSR